MFRKFSLTVAVTVIATLVAPAISRADFTMTLSDGSNNATLALTNGAVLVEANSFGIVAGTNLNTLGSGALNGFTTVSNGATAASVYLMFDGFQFLVAAGSSNFPGNLEFANLQLTNFTVQNVGSTASSLTISLTETGFSNPNDYRSMSTIFNANISPATSTTTINESSTYSDGSTTVLLTSPTGTAGSPLSGQVLSIGLDNSSSAFSINDTIVITGLLDDGSTATASVNAGVYAHAPAPSGLILAATMMPFFGLLRRRLRRVETPAIA